MAKKKDSKAVFHTPEEKRKANKFECEGKIVRISSQAHIWEKKSDERKVGEDAPVTMTEDRLHSLVGSICAIY